MTIIRDATEADLPALAAIYRSSGVDVPGTGDAASIAASWQRLKRETPTAQVLVAERDGQPIGTLTLFVLPMLGHGGDASALVEMVAVDGRMQGQGIGRALMDEAMRRARAAGCYKLALSSNDRRTRAHRFYEGLGYQRHGVSFVATIRETAS